MIKSVAFMNAFCRCALFVLLSLSLAGGFAGCTVHQWPDDMEEREEFILRLHFNTLMTVWEHYYDINTRQLTPVQNDNPLVYDNTRTSGTIRYIVRIYHKTETNSQLTEHTEEYIFSRELTEQGYDFETPLLLPAGEYTIRVWADVRDLQTDSAYYDATDFARIELTEHIVNTDYRDAFRGFCEFSLDQRLSLDDPLTVLEIDMFRPLAKFEFVADGLDDFRQSELTRGTTADALSDYDIILAYTGYTPSAYSMITDSPNDSRYGEQFRSSFGPLEGSSASLGFDYVFARTDESSTWMQIGVFDDEGQSVALTDPILIPLKRDHHTLIRGRFLETHASGGFVGVDPGFDGDFNIIR